MPHRLKPSFVQGSAETNHGALKYIVGFLPARHERTRFQHLPRQPQEALARSLQQFVPRRRITGLEAIDVLLQFASFSRGCGTHREAPKRSGAPNPAPLVEAPAKGRRRT